VPSPKGVHLRWALGLVWGNCQGGSLLGWRSPQDSKRTPTPNLPFLPLMDQVTSLKDPRRDAISRHPRGHAAGTPPTGHGARRQVGSNTPGASAWHPRISSNSSW